MRNGYRPQEETFILEPDEVEAFDVRTLADLYNVKNAGIERSFLDFAVARE